MASSHSSSQQGHVKDPQHDQRLKENREPGGSANTRQEHASGSGHQGEVKDPAHDGRLKENRDSGTSKGSHG